MYSVIFGVTLFLHKGPRDECVNGVHTHGEIVGLDMGREEDTCNMCFRTLSHSEESTKWEIGGRSRDVERGRLAWGVNKIAMVSRGQNFGKFTFFKVYGVCTPGGLSNPSKSGTMRKFRQSYGTHFSSIFEIRPRSRDTAV